MVSTCSTIQYTGRISFYDQYGVIRDVIQNHLTEVMTLLTLSLPANMSNCDDILQNKLKLFSVLKPLDKRRAVIGQYQSYNAEVQQELNKTMDHVSLTPTFAGKCGVGFNSIPALNEEVLKNVISIYHMTFINTVSAVDDCFSRHLQNDVFVLKV